MCIVGELLLRMGCLMEKRSLNSTGRNPRLTNTVIISGARRRGTVGRWRWGGRGRCRLLHFWQGLLCFWLRCSWTLFSGTVFGLFQRFPLLIGISVSERQNFIASNTFTQYGWFFRYSDSGPGLKLGVKAMKAKLLPKSKFKHIQPKLSRVMYPY